MLLTIEVQAVVTVARQVIQEAIAEIETHQVVRPIIEVAIIIATVILLRADITAVRVVRHHTTAVVRLHAVITAHQEVRILHREATIVVLAVVITVLLRVVTVVPVDIRTLRRQVHPLLHLIREEVVITDKNFKQPLCSDSGVTVFLLLKFMNINKKINKK